MATYNLPANVALDDLATPADWNALLQSIERIAAVPIVLAPSSAVLEADGTVSLNKVDGNTPYFELRFPHSSDELVVWTLFVPPNLAGDGNLVVEILWHTDTASATRAVRWQSRFAEAGADEDTDLTPGSAQAVTSAAHATANRLRSAVLTHATPGLTANKLFAIEVSRLGTHTADDLTDSAKVRMVRATLETND